MRTGQNGENRNRNRNPVECTNNRRGNGPERAGAVWSGPPRPRGFSLWRAETRGSKWDMRRDAFFIVYDTHIQACVHIDAHTCRHQRFGIKTWAWTKVWSVRPCCAARKQKWLWCYILIYARSQPVVLVNGSNWPWYMSHTGALGFAVSSSCCLALLWERNNTMLFQGSML